MVDVAGGGGEKMLDPLDHPIISFLIISAIAILAFFGILALAYYGGNYRCIDVDGNEGFARWCNGDGLLNCYTDKGYVQVKEFHKND